MTRKALDLAAINVRDQIREENKRHANETMSALAEGYANSSQQSNSFITMGPVSEM